MGTEDARGCRRTVGIGVPQRQGTKTLSTFIEDLPPEAEPAGGVRGLGHHRSSFAQNTQREPQDGTLLVPVLMRHFARVPRTIDADDA